jgi:hypothetical protein
LTNVTIGNGVTEIDSYAFQGCTSLTSISVSEGNSVYDSRDNCNAIIKTATNALVFGCSATIIPDSVTYIGDFAFYKCTSLTSIAIPDSVTSIGDSAFSGCTSLTSITIPNSVTRLSFRAFWGCTSLTNVTIGNGVTEIEWATFQDCTSLTSITIPNSVTSIVGDAFYNCTSMQYYDFSTHESVPTLAKTSAFSNIPSTCKIIVPDALYDEWIAATNWSTYASYIIKKSDWDASQTTE